MFPSPCGDYGSYHGLPMVVCSALTARFRPLAGIMVLIYENAKSKLDKEGAVSVPLRGLWFLSKIQWTLLGGKNKTSFRPLAGIMVLINIITKQTMYRNLKGVSVPLRGLWFLSNNNKPHSNNRKERVSVPLRGLWFLSLLMALNYKKILCMVSVPLRGLWFLSPRN